MAGKMEKIGYGQIEPNRLTAQKTREVYAQLPAAAALKIIENGMALVYDQVKGEVHPVAKLGDRAGVVMNEVILEEASKTNNSDYVMRSYDATIGQTAVAAYPRVYALHLGDSFTTNVVKEGAAAPKAGDTFAADTDGYWAPITSDAVATAELVLTVTPIEAGKNDTLPDGQKAVHFTVTKA